MYIVGGGNNTAGCADLVALDLAPLAAHPAADVSAAADSEGDADPQELPTLTWSHVVSRAPCDTHQKSGLGQGSHHLQ